MELQLLAIVHIDQLRSNWSHSSLRTGSYYFGENLNVSCLFSFRISNNSTNFQAVNNEKNVFYRVTIFFKTPQVITYKRAELYTATNILAIGGGLLGLFLGISAMSVIEFIYYFTIRMYWNIQQLKPSPVLPFRQTTIATISNNIHNDRH